MRLFSLLSFITLMTLHASLPAANTQLCEYYKDKYVETVSAQLLDKDGERALEVFKNNMIKHCTQKAWDYSNHS